MAYCTQGDLEDRYGEDRLVNYTDHDGDGTPDSDTVSAAIEDAQAEVDSYIQTRYDVPVSPVPDVLQLQTARLALYNLALQVDSVTEDIEAARKAAIKWLEGVAAGRVTLAAETTPDDSESASGVSFESKDRVFGRDKFL